MIGDMGKAIKIYESNFGEHDYNCGNLVNYKWVIRGYQINELLKRDIR